MKYLKSIICLLLALPMTMVAQNNKKPIKTRIGKLDNEGVLNSYVKHGEFRIDFDNKVTEAIDYFYAKNYRYMMIVRDSKDNILYVKMNNYELKLNNVNVTSVIKTGYTNRDFVYVEKRNVTNADNPKYRYYLHIAGRIMGPYDEILDMFQDGFIYKVGDTYSFGTYTNGEDDNIQYTIPDEALYVEKTIRCNLRYDELEFKPTENVRYYKTNNGHYYLLYYDNYMDNTLLVVDSTGYELDGVMEKIDFKYSQNGEHWIAAYTNNLMVDGMNVLQLPDKIKHIAIKNDGEYAFVVEGKGKNDKLYYGNDMVMQGVDMKWLAVDAKERFNYICRGNKGYFYGIDNEMFEKNDDMKKYYYPALFDSNEKFVVKSKDGKHKMEYSYDTPYIMIDNMRLDCQSIPHYAIWNDKERCFMWNVIEGVTMYVYKYKVKR